MIEKQKAAKEQAMAAAEAKAEKPEPCVKLARIFGAGSDLTDLQKEERWKQYKGKDFAWDLKIIEVSTGPLGGVHVEAECPALSRCAARGSISSISHRVRSN